MQHEEHVPKLRGQPLYTNNQSYQRQRTNIFDSAEKSSRSRKKTREEVLDQCEQAISTMSDDTIGYVYVLFPGKENWESYWTSLRDSQLQFFQKIGNHSFKHAYIINGIMMRKKRKYMAFGSPAEGGKSDLRTMDVLILTHKYDSLCLYLTAPIIFESQTSHPEYSSIILDAMEEKIRNHSYT